MKMSIAKKLIISVSAMFLVVMIAVSLGLYFFITNFVMNNTMQVAKSNAIIFSNMVYKVLLEDGGDITDKNFFDEFEDDFSKFCNENNIDYLYVFEPDFEKNEVNYCYVISGSSEKQEEIKNLSGTKASATLGADIRDVWDGKRDIVHLSTNNQYGREINTFIRIDDFSGNKVLVGFDTSINHIYKHMITLFRVFFVVLLIFLLLMDACIYIIFSKCVVDPAKKISSVMNEFVLNDCKQDKSLQIKSGYEFSVIADSYNKMAENINKYITDIQSLTTEREKINAEINIASEIQKGLLPQNIVENTAFEIDAMMLPARYIGGDLYDYMKLDDDRILLVIADVSGKGVSAAMFMSITLTLIRQYAKLGKSVSEILYYANKALCENNSQMLFVTVFLAIYDKAERKLTYANAGHNYPYILGKELKILDDTHCIPIGMFEDGEYTESEAHIDLGDILFMYTDGINEAVSIDKKLYGVDKLEKCLLDYRKNGKGSIVDYVYSSVSDFAEGTEQSDDITMLSLSVRDKYEFELDAQESQFVKIKQAILDSSIPKKYKLKLCLACEEWFVNICSYAYKDICISEKKVHFKMEISDRIIIEFKDNGKKYDPLKNVVSAEEYDVVNQVGGLGKLIITKISDETEYKYSDNKNILTITKYIQEEQK